MHRFVIACFSASSRSVPPPTATAPPHEAGAHARSISSRSVTCKRDANGRIKRVPAARHAFQHQHTCQSTGKTCGSCPAYVDHIVPLKPVPGGADFTANMEWQITAVRHKVTLRILTIFTVKRREGRC